MSGSAITEYRGFFTGVVFRVLGIVVSLISTVITARGLGLAGRGLLHTCTAASTIGAQILALGMPSALVLVVASRPALARRAIPGAIAGSTGAGIAFLLLAQIVSASAASNWIPSLVVELAPIVSGLVAAQVLLAWCSSLTQALGLVDQIPRIELLYRAVSASWAWLALFQLRTSFRLFLWSLFAVDCLCGIGWLLYVRALAPAAQKSPPWPRAWSRWSLKAYLPLVLNSGMRRADVLLVTSLAGVRATGLYSIGTQVMDLCQIGPVFLGQKAMFSFSAGHGDSLSLRRLRRSLPFAIMIVMLMAGLTAESWAPLLFGTEFTGAGPIIMTLSLGAGALAWETVASQEIAASGFPIRLSVAWFVSFCAAMLLMLLLVPPHAAAGAGISLSAAYLLLSVLVYRIRSDIRASGVRSEASGRICEGKA